MAEKHNVKLPEDVAAAYKYVGTGHTRFTLPQHGNRKIDLETITLADAERFADLVFLKRKPKPKAPPTEKM